MTAVSSGESSEDGVVDGWVFASYVVGMAGGCSAGEGAVLTSD